MRNVIKYLEAVFTLRNVVVVGGGVFLQYEWVMCVAHYLPAFFEYVKPTISSPDRTVLAVTGALFQGLMAAGTVVLIFGEIPVILAISVDGAIARLRSVKERS
ncbi:hypothetical protein ACV22V_30730 [Burkholderia sp. AW33-5]